MTIQNLAARDAESPLTFAPPTAVRKAQDAQRTQTQAARETVRADVLETTLRAPTPIVAQASAPVPPAPVPAVPGPNAAPIATPAPSDFRATPPAVPIGDITVLRAKLAEGEPFAADVATALRGVTEAPLHAGGLVQLFAPLIPNATWTVSNAEVTDQGVRLCLSAIDRSGLLAFAMELNLCRFRNGVLEMHVSNMHTGKMYRGWALTAQIEARQAVLLHIMSLHPDSRITIVAGEANALTGTGPNLSSAYQLAKRGYQFADTFGVTSTFFEPHGGPHQFGQRNMRTQLLKWCLEEPSLALNGKPLTKGQRRALRERLYQCRLPSDFAELSYPNYTASAGDQHNLSLGQAFMLSGCAPLWCGVRYFNKPGPRTGNGHALMRGDSFARFLQTGKVEMAGAAERRRKVTQALWQAFNSPAAEQRCEAYRVLGRGGEASVERYLRARRKDDPDTEARAAAKEALRVLRGTTLVPNLQAVIGATDDAPLRAALQERLAIIQGSDAAET